MPTILHLGVLAVAIALLSRVLPSVRVRSVGTAVWVAIVFSVLNFFLGWLIRLLLFVPALLTLGLLFLFLPLIVNAILLWLTDRLIASFEIRTAGALWLTAAVITLVNSFFYAQLFQAAWQGAPIDAGSPGVSAAIGPRWI